jgi:ribulose-5-phosphate 4-epimerase/fuculose-1-phosphate aldolase
MKFAVIKNDSDPTRDRIADAIVRKCLEHGHELSAPDDGVQFVLNLTGTDNPNLFRRRAQSIFIFTLVKADRTPRDLRSLCYTTLVRTLSNVVICAVPGNGFSAGAEEKDCEIYFTTPEAGFYHLAFDPEEVYQRIAPIAGAHFAIGNRLETNLPPRFWETSPIVEQIKEYGRELDKLGVLPAPFPLGDVLSEESIRDIYRLFEMRGLSYGNLSARERVPELGETTFWMTARGIDKGNVTKVGRDVLLVRGFDYEAGRALVSVPPDHDEKARVSVDAVEHELIYRRFPDVGAIVHVHAWLDGVPCTGQNYPCGTIELARDVADLLGRTDRPARTAVGLKNHGLTITGPSLADIFARIRGRLRTEVWMAA